MWRLAVLSLLVALLGACNAYHPLKDGVGYTEVPMGPNTFQVTYVGTQDMAVAEARQYCLTRAAELTVLHGLPFFQILDERVYISYGSQYWPGYYSAYPGGYGGYGGRHGYHYYRYYEPGYVEQYTMPEVTMRVLVQAQAGPTSVPAAYLIQQAVERKIPLTPGVEERARAMPTEPGAIPPPPPPTTRPRPAG